jgi:hypothetical protein
LAIEGERCNLTPQNGSDPAQHALMHIYNSFVLHMLEVHISKTLITFPLQLTLKELPIVFLLATVVIFPIFNSKT